MLNGRSLLKYVNIAYNGLRHVSIKNKRIVFATVFLINSTAIIAFAALITHQQLMRTQPAKALTVGAVAPAVAIPASATTTFWQIVQKDINGPQARICAPVQPPVHGPTMIMLFNEPPISAWYEKDGYATNAPIMRYSDDAAVPAFWPDMLGSEKNAKVQEMIAGAQLIDGAGNLLHDNTIHPPAGLEPYHVYARYSAHPGKEYLAACSVLTMDITIAPRLQTFTSIAVYNGAMEPGKLAYTINQDVTTSTPHFDKALPAMQAAGFNLAAAKSQFMPNAYLPLINTEAGFTFSYLEPLLGQAQLHKTVNKNGQVSDYTYSFPKQPDVSLTVQTIYSHSAPIDAAAFNSLAKQKGWIIKSDTTGNDSHVPGCKPGDTENDISATDLQLNYNLLITNCGAYPSVYTVFPTHTENQTTGYSDAITPIAGWLTFKPGTNPPQMH